MFENAVNSQNQQNVVTQAATTQGISQLYSLDTIADAVSMAKILNP
ncbi:RebB family R body protein, partial [Chryseobacterium rhizosphaerae]